MTSRAEYRLLLRQDNADLRLTEKAYKIGMIDEKRYSIYKNKKNNINNELERLKNSFVNNSDEVNRILENINSKPLKKPSTLYDLIKRTELDYDKIHLLDYGRNLIDFEVKNQINIIAKYEGYIKKQEEEIKAFKKMESKIIPKNINYNDINGLRLESRHKLNLINPQNIGQASRIPGVSPADISVLMLYIEMIRRDNK